MRSLRAHRISELTAAIHELDRSLATHRTAAPGYDAAAVTRALWMTRGRALEAERARLLALRAHEVAKAGAEAPC